MLMRDDRLDLEALAHVAPRISRASASATSTTTRPLGLYKILPLPILYGV